MSEINRIYLKNEQPSIKVFVLPKVHISIHWRHLFIDELIVIFINVNFSFQCKLSIQIVAIKNAWSSKYIRKNRSTRNFHDIQFKTFLFDSNCWQQKAEEWKRIDLSYQNIMMISEEKKFSSNHKHGTHDFTILKSFISQFFIFFYSFSVYAASTLFFKFYFSFINKMKKKWRQRKKVYH